MQSCVTGSPSFDIGPEREHLDGPLPPLPGPAAE